MKYKYKQSNPIRTKRILTNIAYYLTGVMLALWLAVLMLEWAAGCGEYYEDAQGIVHIQDCVFIDKL